MFSYFRSILSTLAFPGVIAHEWAHKKFCDWTGVRVQKVVYFRFGNPAGYVSHDPPQTFKQTFWISVGPLVVNSVLAVILSYVEAHSSADWQHHAVLLWLALSFGMTAFPSNHDMQHIAVESKTALWHGGSLLHLLSFPFVALISLANSLRYYWFDIIYAIILIKIGGGVR